MGEILGVREIITGVCVAMETVPCNEYSLQNRAKVRK